MRLTEHFTLEEMQRSANAEALHIDNTIPDKLVSNALRVAVVLETIREHFGKPIDVLSCYRSPEVNAAVGGSSKSAHMNALAADGRIKGVSVKEICEWVRDNVPDYDQIIYEFGEQGWFHVGLSYGSPRKQALTAVKENGKTVYKAGII